jgi:GNAT acetyltransferase-like protein
MDLPAALVRFDDVRKGSDWKRWRELASGAAPFLAPEFFALVKPLARADAVVVAEAWSPGKLHGALPLVFVGDSLRSLRSDHSPGYDFCGTREGIEAIWRALREDDRWTELVLEKVPADSLLSTLLPALAKVDGFRYVATPDVRDPYLPLAGFEAAMNPKFRTNLARCARKAGDIVLERILVPSRADLAEAEAIEAKAWKGAAGTAITSDPKVEHLYRAMSRVLGRRRQASLYFLRVGGKRVATLFALENRGVLYALKIGYDPAYANLSPGHLIAWKVAADAEQRGLTELDFVGREDEWKHKWTDRVHEHVRIVIYARTLRGISRYALRHVIRPALPATARETPRSPLPRHCQHADVLGAHTTGERLRGRIAKGLGIKTGLKRMLTGRAFEAASAGEASRFPVGSWVRVLEEPRVRATLSSTGKLRGLELVPVQLATCGKVYRVERHVRRLRDDHGRFRAIDRTVLLEGVDCSGAGHDTPVPTGCGRHCPLMYRDEWLEPATSPHAPPHAAVAVRHAHVRDLDEIYAGLDAFGRRDGLTFMPEMAQYAGKRFAVAQRLSTVFEYDRWIEMTRPIYILRGLHCTGAVLGSRGPCDRACAMLWHEDWLVLEDARQHEV